MAEIKKEPSERGLAREIEGTLQRIERECSKELADDLRRSLHSSQTLEEDRVIHERNCSRYFKKLFALRMKREIQKS